MIDFHSVDIEFKLPFDRNKIASFLAAIINSEDKRLNSLTYIFTSEMYLLKINKQFLNHLYHTDVITFDNSSVFGINGEVYISIDYIKKNYRRFSLSFQRELLRGIIHGLLHLIGYNDLNDEEKLVMRNKENYYLTLF